jgi:hypothetical protein
MKVGPIEVIVRKDEALVIQTGAGVLSASVQVSPVTETVGTVIFTHEVSLDGVTWNTVGTTLTSSATLPVIARHIDVSGSVAFRTRMGDIASGSASGRLMLTIIADDTPINGAGSVTSVALSLPATELTVTGSPVASSGTLAATWATQTANKVFASATSGGAATPAFRALVLADIPGYRVVDQGSATLTAGTVTISSAKVTANCKILVTRTAPGGTVIGEVSEDKSSRSNGVSFVIRSIALGGAGVAATLDTSTFSWVMFDNV